MDSFNTLWVEMGSSPVLQLFPKVELKDIFEILVLTLLCYYCIKSLRGTRAWVLFKGALIVLAVYCAAYLAKFNAIIVIFQNLLTFLAIALIVAIQPEIRKFIEKIGTKSLNQSFYTALKNFVGSKNSNKITVRKRVSDNVIQELIKGCAAMAKEKTGALIAIEGDIPLNEFVDSGITLNSDITAALLINIFQKNTPLHDGAVIIKSNKISAATCYLPLSSSTKINKDLGTRHRAAMGLAESTDSFVIIVSEETGNISVAVNGKLKHNLSREALLQELNKFQMSSNNADSKVEIAKLQHNLPLKLSSIAVAFMLWVIVMNAANPITTATFKDVEIYKVNEGTIMSIGKTYEVLSGDTVDVKVSGRKNILDDIPKENIRVVADFSKLSYTNAVPLYVTVQGYSGVEATLSDSTMMISLEDVVTAEFNVKVNIDTRVDESQYISGVDLSSSTLVVSGAKSVVNTIDYVSVTIADEMITKDNVIKLEPEIYDKNGDRISLDKFTTSADTIEATIRLYDVKQIPLNISVSVTNPIIKALVQNITYSIDTVSITGPDDVLYNIDSLDITVPVDISMDNLTSSQFTKNVSLQEYLPDDITLTSQTSTVNVIVELVDFYVNSMDITPSDITVNGLADTLEATIDVSDTVINVMSLSEDIKDKKIDYIKPCIDLKGLGVGEHVVTLKFAGYNKYITGVLTVKVNITARGE